jgi:hypothetical protein
MKVTSFMDVLGLTVIAVIVLDIVSSKNTAGIISNAGSAWGNVLRSAQGR